ncbi:carbamoyltransferase C-terminal domain-containing protein [Lentzea sp.]|uniref:carbamoyltransferase C-terminal domain-containing protein n=1 Tax=Lentzea sp. TaxID=56099 RepID=UPI002BFBB2C5|nr:carbamoyltransferase C-terminal domain-containing protein [Lentzea sp.]HUQ56469.1 carbamoyltransferase C-terminal domain-containing protein [Lentzea sp.]
MKDGYHLSTYLNPAGVHRLADVYFRHDNNVALWEKSGREVRLVRHWELERVTGQKMHRTPFLGERDQLDFVNGLLAPLGLKTDDVEGIWGTPGLSADDHVLADLAPDIAFHSIAHLYSAILLDSDVFFDGTIVGLAVDRGPDRLVDRYFKENWYAGAVVRRGVVELCPVESPANLYCEARDLFELREGTLMALATATTAQGSCDREAVLREFRFVGHDGMAQAKKAFAGIVAQVRATVTPDPAFTERESLISAVMKEVQAICVAMMERNVDMLLDRYDVDPATAHLALSGGYALNCPTNSHLVLKYGFRGLLAPPCVGDSGQAIGIGLAAFHRALGRFDFRFPGPYLGTEDLDVDGVLAAHDEFVESVSGFDLATAVRDLRAGPVVWFDGMAESGPRALGHRSLLGDPTTYDAKTAVNELKRREWWRPVAPVVLEEHLDGWFENARPSPFMLETFTIRPERRDLIPAVAHLDHSARVQSLRHDQNPALHELITAFHEESGVPMLCNTSLNDKGEPIIDTLAQAVNFCLRRRVSIAYFNGRRVVFRAFDRYPETEPLPRVRAPFTEIDDERAQAIRDEANPHGLPDLHLHLFLRDLELYDRFDIRTRVGADLVGQIIDQRLRDDPDLARRTADMIARTRLQFANFGGPTVFGGRRPVDDRSEMEG